MVPAPRRRILANFAWLSVSEFLVRLVGIVIYLARVLGASGYGELGVVLSLTSIFEILVRAGAGPYGGCKTARNPSAILALRS